MLFCEIHDLVWETISVSEKRMKNSNVKIIHNVFEKNDEGGLFPLTITVGLLTSRGLCGAFFLDTSLFLRIGCLCGPLSAILTGTGFPC